MAIEIVRISETEFKEVETTENVFSIDTLLAQKEKLEIQKQDLETQLAVLTAQISEYQALPIDEGVTP